ncbi:hypothetical protein [Streptomyces nigrescens]|uniref:hypothetical protein n=1 Tax=Streptomyces nigrescens TaxID=1920 RepID=UPI00347899E6
MQGPRRRSSPISAADLPILEDHRNGGNRDQSEAFSITTGISISYGAGASLGFLSASNQISVSLELGYESRREVSFFKSESDEHGLVVPPRKAACLWFVRHELESVRADGSIVSGDDAMSFNVYSTLITQYPPGGAQAVHLVKTLATDSAGWLDPAPDIDFELLAKSEPPAGAVDPAPENANAS